MASVSTDAIEIARAQVPRGNGPRPASPRRPGFIVIGDDLAPIPRTERFVGLIVSLLPQVALILIDRDQHADERDRIE
jgi:hypothetical protein